MLKSEKNRKRQEFADDLARRDAEQIEKAKNKKKRPHHNKPPFKKRTVEERREGGRNQWDPLVVSCEEIRRILLPIVEEKDREYDEVVAAYGNAPQGTVGGMGYIARVVGVDRRRVYSIFHCEQKHMAMHVADEWLGKLGLEYERAHLRPVANPAWSQENWMEWASLNGGCEQIGVTYETGSGV